MDKLHTRTGPPLLLPNEASEVLITIKLKLTSFMIGYKRGKEREEGKREGEVPSKSLSLKTKTMFSPSG
jgi:hypothetical protein